MNKWEYWECTFRDGRLKREWGIDTKMKMDWKEYLERMGNEGWELVTKIPNDSRVYPDADFSATFKRPKQGISLAR